MEVSRPVMELLQCPGRRLDQYGSSEAREKS